MTEATHNLLERHFDTAFEAPDGIAKLRELILTLAMQGRLVEQDPSDPPASELLKEIQAEKEQLVKAGKIKKPKPLPPIKPEEVLYELPKGWEWVRLGEIGIINPRNNAEDSAKAGFVPMPMIPEGFLEKHQYKERPWSEIKKGYTHFSDGDVGMAKITPCFENAKSCIFSGLPNGIGAGTTELHIFRNTFKSVVPRFLLYFLKNPRRIYRAVSKMTGSAGQKRVPTPYFTEEAFPLSPIKEQHRIVDRIDQLMARCNELETLRKEREEKRLAIHAAAINQLLDAPDGAAWNFIQQHFDELYTVKENVAELRKAILQLAVMGRLVPQNSDDPPASELLKEIKAEKQRLVKAGKIKKSKPLPPIKPEEEAFELPQGWEWVRLGDTLLKITDGTHHSPPNDGTGDFLYISAKNIKDDGVIIQNATYVTKEIHDKIFSRCDPEYGNILYIKDGATTGIVTINNLTKPFSMLSSVALLKQPRQIVNRYLLFTLRSPYFYEKMRTGMTGVAITRVTLKKLQDAIIPLPPLPEQHRIVAKIDQLMALCDTLEQQIDVATVKQSEMLNAVMARVGG
jgi:type I restriction enzyme S subunit